jgi:hypothetical protein
MIKTNVDLSALLASLRTLSGSLSMRAMRPVLEASVADHYASQPVPVDTGRLRRALTKKPRSPERRIVVVGQRVMEIHILVPYARYQMHRLAPYEGRDLGAKLSAAISARLAGGAGVAGTGGAP